MKERRKQSGITLIALIVTIIVLIVLAVVSINAIFGADGLVAQARRTNLIVEFTIYLEERRLTIRRKSMKTQTMTQKV